VPAAAVIPAPIAYIKVVAVKKLVVEPWARRLWSVARPYLSVAPLLGDLSFCGKATRVTVKKLECLKQAIA
jgi:hypothetical protein